MSVASDAKAVAKEVRYELKFAAAEAAQHRIRRHLSLVPGLLRRQHPARVVHSLYLDTPSRTALDEARDGASERQKLRLRWYGDRARGASAFLERKESRAGLVHKERTPLSQAIDVAGARRGELMQALRAACPELNLADLEPSQWVRYRREYLVDARAQVRVTLDTQLTCHDQSVRGKLQRSSSPTRLPRLVIVEIKFAQACAALGHELARALPLRRTRCSKYALACDPGASGPLPDRVAI